MLGGHGTIEFAGLTDLGGGSASKVLAESKRMMYGHKWRLAYLDASFIGWWLLVVLTFVLAGLFINPYMGVTYAAFYEDMLDRDEVGA